MEAWKRYFHDLLAAEISLSTRYYDSVVQYGRVGGDDGYLLSRIDAPSATFSETPPDLSADDTRGAVLLNGTLNRHLDVQELLTQL
jgi:hypothetical protein